MIFLGSRGLGDVGGLLMGSVSHKVMHLAPCTCVAVKRSHYTEDLSQRQRGSPIILARVFAFGKD